MQTLFPFFYKTSYLNEINCAEPYPSVRIPCSMGRIGCQLGLELSYNANQATLIQHGNPDIPCLEDAKQQ
jgi:hypothetical protein